MRRTTKPGERNKSNRNNNSILYGEEGAPGYMKAPGGGRCPEKKDYFPHLGDCVNLAICAYYCESQCNKYKKRRKTATKISRKGGGD